MFFDEEMLLDFRLNYLNDYVDKFVVVESSYTHSGEKRKLLFDINKFKKFVEIGSYPFFRLGKIGVSVVVRSSKKSNLQSCHKDIIRIMKNKKIKTIRGI